MQTTHVTPLRRTGRLARAAMLLVGASAALGSTAFAQDPIPSRLLSDKIFRGDGVIDLLRNVSAPDLQTYFNSTGNRLLLGADLNESAAPPASPSSVGVAIKDIQLRITTTAGDFTFSDFFTATTSTLRETGSNVAAEYYTLFGKPGSNQLTPGSGTRGMDDLLWLENISFEGDILGASMQVTFLETPTRRQGTTSEQFFNFSGGFEEFALLSLSDAMVMTGTNPAVGAANPGVIVNPGASLAASLAASPPGAGGGGGGDASNPAAPGAPSPPLIALAAFGVLMAIRSKRNSAASKDETPLA